MTLPDGRPKGAALVLEESGYDTRKMKLEDMQAILADHEDFKNEKCRVDRFLSNVGHTCVFIYWLPPTKHSPLQRKTLPTMCVVAGTICLHSWRDRQLDRN